MPTRRRNSDPSVAIVRLLQDLVIVVALGANASPTGLAKFLGVRQERVSKVSKLLKSGPKKGRL